MENQTKYRILGILVIIGLVVIFMPVFQSDKEDKQVATTEMMLDQKTPDVVSNESPTIPIENVRESAPHPDDGMVVTALPLEEQINPPQKIMLHPKKISPEKKSIALEKHKKAPSIVSAQMTQSEKRKKVLTQQKTAPSANLVKNTPVKVIKNPHLNRATWVVQVASYADKLSALHMLQRLRKKGYAAFVQEISRPNGDELRIFVGPSEERKTALQLRNQISKDVNLQGIIIKYQPLALLS